MYSAFLLLLAVVLFADASPLPQDGKFGAELSKSMGNHPNLNVYGNHEWAGDRGALGVSGNHQRELGGFNRHQTNLGVQGKYDVFRSDDGRTTGSVFGGANQQWNSHGPNTRGYEYGGRVEHTWGRK